MVSKRLMGVWAVLDFSLLAAGVASVVLSIVWRAPNLLVNMVLPSGNLMAGMILGVALLLTFALSVGAIVQRSHITIGLVILNYALLIDSLLILIVGTVFWFPTLQMRANFRQLWVQLTPEFRRTLQDQLQCCGYFNGTDTAEIGGFCQSQEFINNLNATVETNFCVAPITAFADGLATNVFTTIYAYMAITICLLLATCCVIKKRQEDERFKKIDAKRGGRGFV